MATSAQLAATLRVRFTFGVDTPVPPNTYENYVTLNDISDWASILNPGETVKTLYHLQSQVDTTVYKSAGFDTDDYTSPEYPTNNPLGQQELPEAANGDPVEGVYKVTVKVQFYDGVTATIYEVVVNSEPLCLADAPTVVLSPSYDCDAATFTSTDATNYGNNKYTLESRVCAHTVTPPAITGYSPVTVNSPVNTVNNLWNNSPYQYKVVTTVTYSRNNNYFIFVVTGNGHEDIVCDDALCTLYCLLKKIRDEYYAAIQNPSVAATLYNRLMLGMYEYFMAIQARTCGKNVSAHVAKFYEVTKLDPNCDCGCTSGAGSSAAAPVVPIVQGTQGEPGEDGLTPEFRVTNAFLFQWKYTTQDASFWTTLADLSTFVGAAGADGSTVLEHIMYDAVAFGVPSPNKTQGFPLVTLTSAPIPANSLSANKDTIEAETTILSMGADAAYEILFKRTTSGGTVATLATGYLIYGGMQAKLFRIKIVRTSSSTIRFNVEECQGPTYPALYESNSFVIEEAAFTQVSGDIGSFDFTVEHTIYVNGRTIVPPNEVKAGEIYVKLNKTA